MKQGLKNPLFWGLSVIMLLNIYLIAFYAPVERTMGVVQKVFYFHVASAWVGLLALTVVFAASIAYLMRRTERPITCSSFGGNRDHFYFLHFY